MELSQESRLFLDNLRLYLISSGKNENVVVEVVGELEDHLYEAERNGKNVETITGQSPKAYMEELADEIPFDYKSLLKYIPLLILGAFSFEILDNALHGGLEFSVLQLIGYPVAYIAIVILIAFVFKYISSTILTKSKERLLFYILGLLPIGLFIALIYLNKLYPTPMVKFGTVGTTVAVTAAIIFFIAVSIWSRTWVLIIIPTILYIPQFIINLTDFNQKTKVFMIAICLPVCIGMYLLSTIVKLKKKKR